MRHLPERRIKPRVLCDYPVIIEGNDVLGGRYNEHAILANLSASGLYLKAYLKAKKDTELFVTVLLSHELINEDTPRLVTSGIVVRSEPQLDGTYGIAIQFTHYRFL